MAKSCDYTCSKVKYSIHEVCKTDLFLVRILSFESRSLLIGSLTKWGRCLIKLMAYIHSLWL